MKMKIGLWLIVMSAVDMRLEGHMFAIFSLVQCSNFVDEEAEVGGGTYQGLYILGQSEK